MIQESEYIYDRRYTHYFPPFFSIPASLVACLTSASVKDLFQAGISSLVGDFFAVLTSFCLPASELESGCLGVGVVAFPGNGLTSAGSSLLALVEAAGSSLLALAGSSLLALVEAAVVVVDFPGSGLTVEAAEGSSL
jgi:hypothetical protein